MLGKLMKHEFKATARIFFPLYLLLACISIINRFTLHLNANRGVVSILTNFSKSFHVLLSIGILAVTALFMILRFYKNLLSDEGYLMFTLPVKTHELITSKLLMTLFWFLAGLVVILFSVFIVFGTLDNVSLFMEALSRSFRELHANFGGNWVAFLMGFITLGFLGLIAHILLVYVSIATGQLFSRHKLIASFVAYGAFYMAIQIFILTVLMASGQLVLNNTYFVSNIPRLALPIGIVFVLLECILFYGATYHILDKKLNLE